MILEFIKDTKGIYNDIFIKGEIKEYQPWLHSWQGMTEPERVAKGLFVECYGHGEFQVFTKENVKPVIRGM